MDRGDLMSAGSRLMTFFQMLEKLSSQKASPKFTPDDVQQLRYITSKLLQYVTSADKTHRDLIIKSSSYLDILLEVLESCSDGCTIQNIVYILHELISKTHAGKRVSTLVNHGATHCLFHVLVNEVREANSSEELVVSVHNILIRLASKDRKFGVKARLSQCLSVSLALLRNYTSHPKILQPVVHLLKLVSSNTVNASYLGKNGAVSYLFKVLSSCGRKHLTLVKYTLDTISLLVKSKSNSARAVGQGAVPYLLTMYYDWHKNDVKNRHVTLRKSILSCLRNITNLKSGRRALMDADGVRLLYAVCQESADCKELESNILMASIIMRKCFPRNRLPLSALHSALSHKLPASDFHVLEANEGHGKLGEENGYESSVDNDDDVSSDDDPDTRKLDSDDDDADLLRQEPHKRTSDDLAMYAEFFTEMTQFDSILEEDMKYISTKPIVVPSERDSHTKRYPLHLSHANNRPMYLSHSNGDLPQQETSHTSRCRTSKELDNSLLSSLAEFKVDHKSTHIYNMLDNEPDARPHRPNSSQSVREMASPKSDGLLDPINCSSYNATSGACAFSLDISPKSSKKMLHNKSPRLKRKISKSKGKAEKRGKNRGNKVDEWLTVSKDKSDVSDEDDSLTSVKCDDISSVNTLNDIDLFTDVASLTKSVGRFNKLAYPELYGSQTPPYKETLYEKQFGTQRQKMFEDIDRFLNADQIVDKVVYDLDAVVATSGPTYTSTYSNHTNNDQHRVSRSDTNTDHLRFNSQFECGNLRKAIQIRQYEYDLILSPDINTNHHHQWFYFEVSNMEADVKYRFNIVNCEKVNSQFNFGMKPLMYSVIESMEGRPYWSRVGSEICYYKNHFVRSSQTTGGVRGKMYYTGTFTLTFTHEKDVCYLAYHYPYSYSMMQYHLRQCEENYDSTQIYFKSQKLTETIGGNAVPMLTITSHPASYDTQGIQQLKGRPYIFLSGRVHPGESNASWVMQGTIDFLLSDKPAAHNLRDNYIFKIVPMLNPDGVINGNHRCSLVAEDLNRRWLHPCPNLHPTIYHCKGLLQYLHMMNKSPMVYCDFHGHSRRKNVFLYGCSPSQSWIPGDMDNPTYITSKIEDTGYKTLPKLLHQIAPAFLLSNCSFVVEKAKEPSARVVVWRQIGVVRSYTMESTYCGCDQGPYKGLQINTGHHFEMGRKFCEALSKLRVKRNKSPPPGLYQSASSSSVAADADTNSAANGNARCAEDASLLPRSELHDDNSSSSSSESCDEDDDDDDDDDDNDDVDADEIDEDDDAPESSNYRI